MVSSSDSYGLVCCSLTQQVQRFMMENHDAEESRNVSISISYFRNIFMLLFSFGLLLYFNAMCFQIFR